MKQEPEIKIPIEFIGKEFSEHLKIKSKARIFFSGKFGSGKTYFINEFFKKNKEYEVFHLHPVNYQISSNENIIELIKYDILVEMYKKYGEDLFQNTKIDDFLSFSIILKLFWDNNSTDILKNIIGYLPELGRPLQETIGIIEKMIDFGDAIKSGEKDVINEYIQKIKEKKVEEDDFMSEFIRKSISIKKGEKESVLILDDLDRIDPEHIFRVLNIFSAHFRENNTEIPNKFGFDKIILVGDIDNIKSIFYHRYGRDTDFIGYMDKFYDGKIFMFENYNSIIQYLKQIIKKYHQNDIHGGAFEDSGYVQLTLVVIVNLLLKQEQNKYKISLRQLLKGVKVPLKSMQNIKKENYYQDTPFDYICMGLDGMIELFGDKTLLLESLKNLKSTTKKASSSYSYYKSTLERLTKLIFLGLKGNINQRISSKYQTELDNNGELIMKSYDDKKSVHLLIDLLIDYYKNN